MLRQGLIRVRTKRISFFLHLLTITVPAMTLSKLLNRSLVEGRSVSNLAAYLLEQLLEGDSQD